MTSLTDSRPWSLIRWLVRRMRFAMSLALDRALRVRTTYHERAKLLEGETWNSVAVKLGGWFTLYRAFRAFDVGAGDVLIDIGSGAGRAVLVASRLPFRRVIGLELVEHLHRQAEGNLARFRLQRRAVVELVCRDAAEYQLPDDVSVVFLYNPFGPDGGRTFQEVVANILASVDRAPRRLRIIYINPQEHEYLVGAGRCRLVGRLGGLRPTREWARMLATHFYEVDQHPLAPAE
jgi:hypothetical protein